MNLGKLKKTLPMQYMISIYHCVRCKIDPLLISDEQAVINYYKKRTGGKIPDLKNPVKFSEKQQWYKLNDKDELKTKCADKYTVRKYIEDCGYQELLNDLLAVYEKPSQIDLDALPDKFVIKASHGSGFNLIVTDKNKVNWFMWKRIMNSWLHQDIYWSGREWVYKTLKPKLIVEKYLEDESGGLQDFKFFCFNGEPRFMQLEVGRYTDHNTRNFYDMDWNLMPFGKEIPHNPNIKVEKPMAFEEMKVIARKLSAPFQFVRVDLYQVGGKVYFGELTFFPAGGAPDFVPSEYDEIVGKMWDLQKNGN